MALLLPAYELIAVCECSAFPGVTVLNKTTLQVLLLLLLMLMSCVPRPSSAEAEAYVGRYFEAIKNHQYNAALDLYSPKFFERTPKNEWKRKLTSVNETLGDLKGFSLIASRANTGMALGGQEPGTYCLLVFDVNYSKYGAQETFTLFKAKRTGRTEIVGHNIKSAGFAEGIPATKSGDS